ncbi:hypothetical protein R1sor_007587 [Riccia sorocarpa]|uniref:FCP1 homology domain-containing protein n=1 Tax=Riccia sorocarpa TaxID=122646 RepID=A0ABD3HT25_9MARC
MVSRKQDSNDQGSLVEAVKQVNTGEHKEDDPLALVLHHSRSLGSSHFEEIPSVPLFPEQSVEAAFPVPPCETLDINVDNLVLEDQILALPVLATDHVDVGISSVQHDVQAGSLVLTKMSICPASDFMQMDNTLVKASDLLPKKLLILDTEGLLLYAESILDRTSRTAAGHVVGTKKVIRRNDVQEFITRCLELFDISLWPCSDRNAIFEQMYYLFSLLEYDKFLLK